MLASKDLDNENRCCNTKSTLGWIAITALRYKSCSSWGGGMNKQVWREPRAACRDLPTHQQDSSVGDERPPPCSGQPVIRRFSLNALYEEAESFSVECT